MPDSGQQRRRVSRVREYRSSRANFFLPIQDVCHFQSQLSRKQSTVPDAWRPTRQAHQCRRDISSDTALQYEAPVTAPEYHSRAKRPHGHRTVCGFRDTALSAIRQPPEPPSVAATPTIASTYREQQERTSRRYAYEDVMKVSSLAPGCLREVACTPILLAAKVGNSPTRAGAALIHTPE